MSAKKTEQFAREFRERFARQGLITESRVVAVPDGEEISAGQTACDGPETDWAEVTNGNRN